jgi:hypothetical protein
MSRRQDQKQSAQFTSSLKKVVQEIRKPLLSQSRCRFDLPCLVGFAPTIPDERPNKGPHRKARSPGGNGAGDSVIAHNKTRIQVRAFLSGLA